MTVGTQAQPFGKLLDYEQFIDHQLQRTRRRIKLTDIATACLTLLVGFLGVLFLEVDAATTSSGCPTGCGGRSWSTGAVGGGDLTPRCGWSCRWSAGSMRSTPPRRSRGPSRRSRTA